MWYTKTIERVSFVFPLEIFDVSGVFESFKKKISKMQPDPMLIAVKIIIENHARYIEYYFSWIFKKTLPE